MHFATSTTTDAPLPVESPAALSTTVNSTFNGQQLILVMSYQNIPAVEVIFDLDFWYEGRLHFVDVKNLPSLLQSNFSNFPLEDFLIVVGNPIVVGFPICSFHDHQPHNVTYDPSLGVLFDPSMFTPGTPPTASYLVWPIPVGVVLGLLAITSLLLLLFRFNTAARSVFLPFLNARLSEKNTRSISR